jgi:hypothetical protein
MAAGEWIPWTKGLTKKPEVAIIARKSGRSQRDVSALLMEFWEWADDHTTDGQLNNLRPEDLGAILPQMDSYFFELLIEVGWLARTESGLRIPKFSRWMGNSSKRRLKEAKRKRRFHASENAAQESGQNARHSTGQNRTRKASLSLEGTQGGMQGGETKSWARGEFAAAVADHLEHPDATTPMDWFPAACERIANAFGYRRLDDPRLLASWAPTFTDCSLAELEAATLQLSEDDGKHPKGRPQCRAMLKRIIVDRRRSQVKSLDAQWHSIPADRQEAIKADVARRNPGADTKTLNAECYKAMRGELCLQTP